MTSKYDPFLQQAINFLEQGKSLAEAARSFVESGELDADPETARKYMSKKIKELRESGGIISGTTTIVDDGIGYNTDTTTTTAVENFSATENKATWSAKINKRITTLEEALEYCDADLSDWEVERWTFNKWEQNNQEEGVVPLYQVKVMFKRKKPEDAFFSNLEAVDKLISSPPKFHKKEYPKYDDAVMLEVCAYDVHYGQLTWAPESGVNYDAKIARKRMMKHMDSLLMKASGMNVDKILFVIGNDFFNSDNLNNTTTAGTPQTEDNRWNKTFDEGTELLIDVIDKLSEVAPVEVVLVQGNHDWERSFYACRVINKHYLYSSDVEVVMDYTSRKYVQYGKCMLGLTHGNNEKEDELPMIMAQEKPQMWASTVYREWHLGHLHHARKKVTRSTQEYRGVTIQRLRSFQPTDAWHQQKAFNGSLNTLYAFAWHKEDGKVMELNENIKF